MKEKVEKALDIKYKDEKIPKDVYDFDNILKNQYPNNNKNTLLKIAASFIVIILVLCGCVTLVIRNNKENNIQEQATVDESIEKGNELPSYVADIKVKTLRSFIGEETKIENVCKVKVEEIEEYSIMENNPTHYPITKVKVKVLENYKGELDDTIEIWVPGGLWKIKDLKNLDRNYYYYDYDLISRYSDEDYVKVNYSENITISEPIVEKEYIATLYKYNNEYNVGINEIYGFKEYNEENNTVMIDNNQWKTLDIEKYLN